MKLFDSDSEAGGCILIVTNLPNAYVADSSVAGCIFSLIQNIFSLLFLCSDWKRAKLPLSLPPTGRDQTQKKTHVVYWKIAMSDHAKTLESRNKQLIHVMCWLLLLLLLVMMMRSEELEI